MIKKLKVYWIKFLKIFTKEFWIGKQPTRTEIFLALYEHIKKNHPQNLVQICHCGNFLNHKNIDIQFNNNFVWVIFQCEMISVNYNTHLTTIKIP